MKGCRTCRTVLALLLGTCPFVLDCAAGLQTRYAGAEELIEQASAICIATAGDISIQLAKEDQGNSYVVVDCNVEKTIQGIDPGRRLQVLLGRTDRNTLQEEAKSLFKGKRYILFLGKENSVEQRHRELVASTGMIEISASSPQGDGEVVGDPLVVLESELLNTLTGDVQRATGVLRFLEEWKRATKSVQEVLEELCRTAKPPLRGQVLAMRIRMRDSAALLLARDYSPEHGAATEMRAAIAGITAPSALPGLQAALSSDAVSVRRGAVEALSGMVNQAGVKESAVRPVLAQALADVDIEVQYHALIGLGRLEYGHSASRRHVRVQPGTNIKSLPSYEDFVQDPAKYVKMWLPPEE